MSEIGQHLLQGHGLYSDTVRILTETQTSAEPYLEGFHDGLHGSPMASLRLSRGEHTHGERVFPVAELLDDVLGR